MHSCLGVELLHRNFLIIPLFILVGIPLLERLILGVVFENTLLDMQYHKWPYL